MNDYKHDLPLGWKWVRLDDICNLITDGTHKTPRYITQGVRFISIANLRPFKSLDFSSYEKYISIEEHKELTKRCKPEKDDILVSKIGTLGIAKRIDFDEEVSIFVGLALVKPNRELVWPPFLEAFLNSPQAKRLAVIGAQGGGRQTLPIQNLKLFLIPLPPYDEQQRIVAVLNMQMAAIERARAAVNDQLEISEKLSMTYLQSIFDNLRAQNWPEIRLGDVCEEITGTRNPFLIPNEPFYYVDITSVDNHSKRITTPKILLGKDAPSRARQVIKQRDVIVSTTRPNLNAVALVQPELDNQICSTGFCVLRPKENLDANYLFMFVQSPDFVNNLNDLVKGALYPAVTDKLVRSQFIPLPPIPEQQRIAAILNEQLVLVKLINSSVEIQSKTINELPNVLLQRAFTGGL